jgi:hypothetical protein
VSFRFLALSWIGRESQAFGLLPFRCIIMLDALVWPDYKKTIALEIGWDKRKVQGEGDGCRHLLPAVSSFFINLIR